MKNLSALCLALVLGAASASATILSTNWTENQTIPDGDLNGLALTHTFSSPFYTFTDVTVSLDISGQLNGDLYAYLSFGTDVAILLNRVGKTATAPYGYGDGGLNVTLSDSAPQGDIHTYRVTLFGNAATPVGGPLTGTWAPDARTDSPFAVTAASARTATLSSLANQNPNGEWTLFLADISGGFTNSINSWGISVNGQIPEPSTLLLLLSLGGLALGWRKLPGRSQP